MSIHKPEKRKQVLEMLRDPLTCNMGTSKIAKLVGVREFTVRGHKRNVEADGPIYMKGTIEVLDVVKLRLDSGIQSRVRMSPDVISQYVDAIREKASFPPIGVVFDGADYWVWDGFHRVKAHIRARRKTILAEIRQGTRRDAVLLSVRANAEHGMMRTNEDKRRAAETLLRDEEWGRWSDREIGRRCAVDHKSVATVRRILRAAEEDAPTGEIPQSEHRKGADGRTINTANIGRSSKAKEVRVSTAEADHGPAAETEERPDPPARNGRTKSHETPPQFVPDPLPLDPDAAVRVIVKHFQGDALDALIRGLANWAGITEIHR